jgi:hypothetical protein
MHPLAIRCPAHLVVELVSRELECRKDVGCGSHGAEYGASGATGQLDAHPLPRLSRTSLLSDVYVDPFGFVVELRKSLEPCLRAVAELPANSRVVGPDDDIHPATSSDVVAAASPCHRILKVASTAV